MDKNSYIVAHQWKLYINEPPRTPTLEIFFKPLFSLLLNFEWHLSPTGNSLSALFTEKYADFIEANRTEDSVVRLKELKRLVSKHLMCC